MGIDVCEPRACNDPGKAGSGLSVTSVCRIRPVITLNLLRSKYHLPISKAAKELGMGVTVMKKYCRKFGINRWPFRKLNSMTKLISSVQQSNPSGKVGTQMDTEP